MTDWLSIEAEARALSHASLADEEATVLPLGSLVAWAVNRFARTDGFSPVHRVREAIGGTAVTFCGEVVPEPVKRVPLSAGLVRTLGRCRTCENRYASQPEHAA